jgi:hypothetical protein
VRVGRRILHLVLEPRIPDDLEPVAEGDTVAFLSGTPARTPGEARCVSPDAVELLDLIFEHDVVMTW